MKTQASEKPNKVFWLKLAGTLLTAALLLWLISQKGEEVVSTFLLISPWRLALALLLTFGSRLAVAMRWYVLLRAVDSRITLGQSLRLTFAGFFASNYLPTTVGGDVVRLAGAVQSGFNGPMSVASLVVDRLVGMAGMVTALPVGLVRFFNSGLTLFGASLPGFSLSFGAAALPAWAQKGWDFAQRQIRRFFSAFAHWSKHPQTLLLSYGFTLLYMVFKFTSIWLVLEGTGQPMDWLAIAGVWSLVYFVTLLPVSINGYGLQEVSVTFLYSNLGGISQEASMAVALLVRTMEMLASLPGALFVPGIIAAQKQEGKPTVAEIGK